MLSTGDMSSSDEPRRSISPSSLGKAYSISKGQHIKKVAEPGLTYSLISWSDRYGHYSPDAPIRRIVATLERAQARFSIARQLHEVHETSKTQNRRSF